MLRILSSLRVLCSTIAVLGLSIRGADAKSLGGNISVFADPVTSTCTLLDETPRLFDVYIVHTGIDPSGMSGSRFRMVMEDGFQATYLGETIALPGYVGSVLSDITIGYGCVTQSTLVLASVSFDGHGTSSPCSFLDIVGVAPFGDPLAQDCIFDVYPAPSVGRLYVNPDPAQCQPHCIVATHQTTWGSVKALYRQ